MVAGVVEGRASLGDSSVVMWSVKATPKKEYLTTTKNRALAMWIFERRLFQAVDTTDTKDLGEKGGLSVY